MSVFTKGNTIESRSTQHFYTPSDWARQNLFYVDMYGHFVCDARYRVEREPFDSYLLIHTSSGTGVLETQLGRSECAAGEVLLVDCNEPHCYYAAGSWEFDWLHFNGAASCALVQYILAQHGQKLALPSTAPEAQLIGEICQRPAQPSRSAEIMTSAQVHRILATLAAEQPQSGAARSDFALVMQAVDYINAHYAEKLTLAALAQRAHVSESAFSHAFKSATGFSPYDFVLNQRINEAKRLLNTTALPVGEIAEAVGFSNAANFVRVFRQKCGETPGSFRQNAAV